MAPSPASTWLWKGHQHIDEWALAPLASWKWNVTAQRKSVLVTELIQAGQKTPCPKLPSAWFIWEILGCKDLIRSLLPKWQHPFTLLPTEEISSSHPTQLSPFFQTVLRQRLPELFRVMVLPKPKEEPRVPIKSIFLEIHAHSKTSTLRRERKSTPSKCVCFED